MSEAPSPVSPINGMADGSAISFHWTIIPNASDYELAVASTTDFGDDTVIVRTGPTNAMTLYQLFPEDGRTLHWRVRANAAGSWTDWSSPASFIAGTTDEPAKPAQAQASTTGSAAEGAAASDRPASASAHATRQGPPPAAGPTGETIDVETLDGSTTLGRAAGYLAVMIVSFLVLLLALVQATPDF